MCAYLKRQVRDEAGDSEANQEQVGEDEGSGGVGDLLDLFVGATGLTGLPEGTGRDKIGSGFYFLFLYFFSSVCARVCGRPHLLAILSLSSSQSLSLQSMT